MTHLTTTMPCNQNSRSRCGHKSRTACGKKESTANNLDISCMNNEQLIWVQTIASNHNGNNFANFRPKSVNQPLVPSSIISGM